jgi:hypothetical protein
MGLCPISPQARKGLMCNLVAIREAKQNRTMNLRALVSQHQQAFKQKIVHAFAAKHSMNIEQVLEEYEDEIERYIQEKYRGVEQAVSEIQGFKRPVVLNIKKLLPLTAVIHEGEVKKYWSGRPVEVEEYREYLDPLV